ncbi:MAG: hypothetical protein AAGJ40_20980 [Planctomycetota bacterium]
MNRYASQFVFAAARFSCDPRTGIQRRHHLNEKHFLDQFHRAVKSADIDNQATPR